ncbi:hypothetical protein BDV96DRAFT_603107 [Lophiotrema nucula]|uniref:Uncharacterized protein n=1 Tax=Lophiotrema nucula TaxID=690887 RepID=A0A6A5YWB6_9PLEO|nr:hypothetical protein BDV96DRAFT_603107 [Lophiotrema nucula]
MILDGEEKDGPSKTRSRGLCYCREYVTASTEGAGGSASNGVSMNNAGVRCDVRMQCHEGTLGSAPIHFSSDRVKSAMIRMTVDVSQQQRTAEAVLQHLAPPMMPGEQENFHSLGLLSDEAPGSNASVREGKICAARDASTLPSSVSLVVSQDGDCHVPPYGYPMADLIEASPGVVSSLVPWDRGSWG